MSLIVDRDESLPVLIERVRRHIQARHGASPGGWPSKDFALILALIETLYIDTEKRFAGLAKVVAGLTERVIALEEGLKPYGSGLIVTDSPGLEESLAERDNAHGHTKAGTTVEPL